MLIFGRSPEECEALEKAQPFRTSGRHSREEKKNLYLMKKK